MRALLALGLGLGLLVVAAGYALMRLPYSTAWLERASDDDVARAPDPHGDFELGAAAWSLDDYTTSPKLEAFRESFRSSCRLDEDAPDPVRAALCISDRMAAEFTHGDPEDEFVSTSFDPVGELRSHRSGKPGHCVSRSAILAGELLSVGIAARVVQLMPLDGSAGHNLVEVWDEPRGWILTDPSYGGTVGVGDAPGSALDLASAPKARFQPVGRAPVPLDGLTLDEVERIFDGLLPAAVVYPEPWLYLRVGEKTAPWPYRGRYVHAGPGNVWLGPGQRGLSRAIGVLLVMSAGVWLYLSARVAGIARARSR